MPGASCEGAGTALKARADKNVDHQKLAKKRGFTGILLESQYQKTIHILNKIAKNEEAGIVDDRDEKDQKPADKSRTAKPCSDAVRSHLSVALADGYSANGKLAPEV